MTQPVTVVETTNKIVNIECHGRDARGRKALPTAIPVAITINRYSASMISVGPKACQHNTGGHGQRCKASHPNVDKIGEGISCPYSFDYPYATEFPEWKMPEELVAPMKEICSVSS